MKILEALSMSNDSESDNIFSFNLLGMKKHIKIDKAKLREAITVCDENIDERDPYVGNKVKCEEIAMEGIDEAEFLKRVSNKINDGNDIELVGGKATGVLPKDKFIQLFKYTNDLARFMDTNGKAEAQKKRMVHFQ